MSATVLIEDLSSFCQDPGPVSPLVARSTTSAEICVKAATPLAETTKGLDHHDHTTVH
jgi:hypothetical protein